MGKKKPNKPKKPKPGGSDGGSDGNGDVIVVGASQVASNQEVTELHVRIADLCEKLRAAQKDIEETLGVNTSSEIDWSTVNVQMGLADADSYFSTGEGGTGEYSPNQVSNALFSIQQYFNVFTNNALTQGDHGSNINKLCTAQSKRVLTRPTDQ